MPSPPVTIPSALKLLGTECTTTGKFVDQVLLHQMRESNNYLCAYTMRNTALAISLAGYRYGAPYVVTLSNIYPVVSEIAEVSIYAMVALRYSTKRVKISVFGQRGAYGGSGLKVYPFIHEIGAARALSSSKYLTLPESPAAAGIASVTIDVPWTKGSRASNNAPFGMFAVGLIAEPHLTGGTVYASAALTHVDAQSFSTATVGATAIGNAVYVDSDTTIEMRRVVRAGAGGYQLDRPWSKIPTRAVDTVTVVEVEHTTIRSVSVVEQEESLAFYTSESLP
jgi:hypothetical protein